MSPKKKKKKNKLICLIVGLVLLLAGFQLVITQRLAAAGEKVKQLEARAIQVESANLLLEEEIAQTGSLTLLIQKAQKLGFVRTSQVIHLTPQLPVALGPSIGEDER